VKGVGKIHVTTGERAVKMESCLEVALYVVEREIKVQWSRLFDEELSDERLTYCWPTGLMLMKTETMSSIAELWLKYASDTASQNWIKDSDRKNRNLTLHCIVRELTKVTKEVKPKTEPIRKQSIRIKKVPKALSGFITERNTTHTTINEKYSSGSNNDNDTEEETSDEGEDEEEGNNEYSADIILDENGLPELPKLRLKLKSS
jgi:hypothetical protein